MEEGGVGVTKGVGGEFLADGMDLRGVGGLENPVAEVVAGRSFPSTG